MSRLTVALIDTENSTTPIRISTGNASAGSITVEAANSEILVSGMLIVSQNNSVPLPLSGEVAEFTHNTNSFIQAHIRNANPGPNASGDLVITADTGSETTDFIDLGINGSGYADQAFNIGGPRDGYLYTSSGNLAIGTANSTVKTILLHTGGTQRNNQRVRIGNGVTIGNSDTDPGANNLTVVGYANATFGNISTFSAQSVTASGVIRDNRGDVRDLPIVNQTIGYGLSLADAGEVVSTSTTVYVPSGIFFAGNAVSVFNNSAASITVTQNASVTMYLAGTATTGNRTLAQRGVATVLCVAANTFVISGAGLT